jgi:FHA domain
VQDRRLRDDGGMRTGTERDDRWREVRLFGRSFGMARRLGQARAAELRGELAEAAALFAMAGRQDEAARVMLLRGDGEIELGARMKHYVQAVATAPDGSPVRDEARRKHASLVLGMASEQRVTPGMRQDLIDAAHELEAVGDHARSAEAYARAGDQEGEARALARAGEVDKLDALLDAAQVRDRSAHARHKAHQELGMLLASGRRREALALARASTEDAIRDQGKRIEDRRAAGDVVSVTLRGQAMRLVLGAEVVVGRTAMLSVASAAVSRQHLAVTRRGEDVVVRDLGGRNGTLLRGLALAGEARVADGIELRLGKEVPLVVRPATELPGAVAIELAGVRYVAPLGPARLGVGAWRLERASDGWVELRTDDEPLAFAGGVQLGPCVTLLRGDAVASERAGSPVLGVEADA